MSMELDRELRDLFTNDKEVEKKRLNIYKDF